jgi:hypothetical protein
MLFSCLGWGERSWGQRTWRERSWAAAAGHLEWIRLSLSHTVNLGVLHAGRLAGVLVLLFITAGSAPLRPHVKSCGNGGEGGGDWGVGCKSRPQIYSRPCGWKQGGRYALANLTLWGLVGRGWGDAFLMEPVCPNRASLHTLQSRTGPGRDH